MEREILQVKYFKEWKGLGRAHLELATQPTLEPTFRPERKSQQTVIEPEETVQTLIITQRRRVVQRRK